ncbi:hypothetical protein [Glaciibacter flavus]|uniref:hypothetical protein n=1 Tax=Orlajensenia flava TaxID=2565934 RepID=UPI003AFF6169
MSSYVLGRLAALPLSPGVEVIAGLLLATLFILMRRFGADAQVRTHQLGSRESTASRLAALGALLALCGWLFGTMSQIFLVEPPSVVWWKFASPIAGAFLGLVPMVVVIARTPPLVEVPVLPMTPRSWSSFTDPRAVRRIVIVLIGLIVVSIVAGIASRPDDTGLYSLLPFEGGSATFYGWAFGLPVMIAAVLLTGLCFVGLVVDARRPFCRPAAVAAETAERRTTSAALLRPTLGALMLSLGGALSLVGDAGMARGGYGIPGVGTFTWSPGYASLAPAILWTGWLMEVVAIAVLVFVLLPARRSSTLAADDCAAETTAGAPS